jgi:cytochrome c553
MSQGPLLRRTLAAAAGASIGVAWVAHAVTESMIGPPDAGRGAAIAAHGVVPGVPACVQCHNTGSVGGGAFPRIAGLSSYYLDKQMHDFASGVRTNAIMTPITKGLSPAQMADLAAYYASVAGPFPALAIGDPALVKRGEQLAKIGDASKDLQSCNDCHGPDGVGEPPAIPYLAGQYAQYIASQLKMWQLGSRKSGPNTMAYIARRLGDQDVAAVAAYFQQVRTATPPAESKE